MKHNKYLRTRLVVIFTLSGLLIFYHLSKIFDLYWGVDAGDNSALIYIQSGIRLAIALSLSLVLLRFKKALWGMWISITALTVTRCLLLWETGPAAELSVYFSYLRGFIFPTIITLLYPSHDKQK